MPNEIHPIRGEARSEICEFFSESTVFVTGATGFIGRLLVEKLLRTCPDIQKIYLLMRPKKDQTIEERFERYFEDAVFARINEESPKALEKVFVVMGDCGLPNLGLNERDEEILRAETNCVFHCAATVKFDEKLQKAAHINVRGTRDLLRMAKEFRKLKSFVYVSTAFSFCVEKNINEQFYAPSITGQQLLTLVDNLSEDQLEKLLPTLLGKWPNTYVFTKSVAEDVIKTEGAVLPVTIVRPSVVIGTAFEPIPGWIDNYYGATGVIAGTGIGLIRTLQCNSRNVADLVPADYVINNMIAVAWNVHQSNREKQPETKAGSKIDPSSSIHIYNYVSGPQNPMTWGKVMDTAFEYGRKINSVTHIWHPYILLVSNRYVNLVLHYLIHLVPAYLVDFLGSLVGKQPGLVKGYGKIFKFMDIIAFFATRQWNFSNDNTQNLWEKMNAEDKTAFRFDMADHDWYSYYASYIRGIRVYVLKDPIETVPRGQAKALKLKMAHYALNAFLLTCFLWLCAFLWRHLPYV